MTLILASEPITVKRIIFRIQSKNFSKLQFTLSFSPPYPLFLSPPFLPSRYVSARGWSIEKNNNKIYVQKIAQVILFFPLLFLLSIFKR